MLRLNCRFFRNPDFDFDVCSRRFTALDPCHTSATNLPDLAAKLLVLHICQARHTVDEGVERTACVVVLCLIELAVGMVLLVILHLSMVHLGRLYILIVICGGLCRRLASICPNTAAPASLASTGFGVHLHTCVRA